MAARNVVVIVVLAVALTPSAARAAATLIPDHTSRLGSCGGPTGPACTWACGEGKSCSADGTCALHATRAFGAVLSVKLDDTACGGPPGSVMTLGLASAGATPFQATQMAFDLCARDVTCTGRQSRACGTCPPPGGLDCFSDGGDGEYPCPPGPVVFFCSDPCGGGAPTLSESNFFDLGGWLTETIQPVPALLRAQLPSPPAAGRPVVYHARTPVVASLDPPEARVCVRVAYTSQDRSLSVCSNDATRTCTTNADCPKGTCESGVPAGLDPTAPDANVSTSVCAGPAADAGRPCAAGGDCDSGTCATLPATAKRFCDVSGTPCDAAPCPGGETCVTCPDPACGDGILDPGEECDAGPFGPGNGCDATCKVESCFRCEGPLGEGSSCAPLVSGEVCDLDGRPCTVDTCDFTGTCQPGGAPTTTCAGALAAKSQVQIKRDPDDPTKAKLKWRWTGAAAFDVGSLGFPTTIDDLSVCVYDQTGGVFEATAPAGGLCVDKPCWLTKKGAVAYKDKEATPDGLVKAQAKSGVAGKGKIQADGKGGILDVPALPLSPPVQVLLVRGSGPLCWEATYPSPTTNEPTQFKAKN
jgi:cysteine-rich repeat protein